MTDHIADATRRQQLAASPDRSVFVSANAGTGKTRVLTNRVLRLLLSDVVPDSILCVTYTKAAAVEMSVRLNEKLALWAVCDESELVRDLQEMGEKQPRQSQIKTARALFAQILDNDDGPRIETVHSFCQSILSRFPIEAGIPPHFQLAGDSDADEILQQCFTAFLKHPGPLQDALSVIAGYSDENHFLGLVRSAMRHRTLLEQAATQADFLSRYEADLQARYDAYEAPETVEALIAAAAHFPLADIAAQLQSGGKMQEKRGKALAHWLALPLQGQATQIDALIDVFLTDGAIRKKLVDKKIAASAPQCEAHQQQLATLLLVFCERRSVKVLMQKSRAFMAVLVQIYQAYQATKYQRSLLDFDDLIHATDQMLAQDQMLDWVRWKLDSGIQHLLVDEAQDTSPAQWALLAKLTQPFFEDEAEERPRTLFAVGDYKQSIYRFQGADPDVFLQQRRYFHDLAARTEKPIQDVQFSASFRSSSAILQFVDKVMNDIASGPLKDDYAGHQVVWDKRPGFVTIWPMQEDIKQDSPPPFLPSYPQELETAATKYADFVADQLAALLASGSDNGLGRQIEPKDIMILVRRRDLFYALLRAALIRQNVPLAPADRVKLLNQIEILDLLALGDVCLLPEDDLQLAAVLKSPLFGLDDTHLIELAAKRTDEESLFSRLRDYQGQDNQIGTACDRLIAWRDRADWLSPFDFFSHILIAEGGRADFYRRLGAGVMDTLDVFLSLARDYAQQQGGGLGGFLRHIRDADVELKRDMAAIRDNQVRILTIHGAKGLEAPIIFLPDMLTPRKRSETLVTDETYLYWPDTHAVRPEFIQMMRETHADADTDETDRLLYVALTRAQQGLYIGGFADSHRRRKEDSWYEKLVQSMQAMPDHVADDAGGLSLHFGQTDKQPITDSAAPIQTAPPDWFYKAPPVPVLPVRPLNPSQPLAHEAHGGSVATDAGEARRRGQLTHQLLEWLPAVPASRRNAALEQFWQAQPAADRALRDTISAEIEQLLGRAELQPLFGPGALIEAPIVGVVADIPVSGQIDRLYVGDDKLIIADFKTGSRPDSPSLMRGYHRQLALYGALLAQIYPDHEQALWLIWTRDGVITSVSTKEADAALAEMKTEKPSLLS